MDRAQFILGLRQSLGGKVPKNVLEENVKYYEDYLDVEIRQGRTEEEVLSELGNPRLLSKTIAEANKHAENGKDYSDAEEYDEDGRSTSGGFMDWYRERPLWFRRICNTILIIGVIFLLFSVFRVLFVPILIIILVTTLIRRLR